MQAIIHAVGPDFGRTPGAFDALLDAYYHSLCVLREKGLHSIAFPLISSGIFGGRLPNPAAESAKQCVLAYRRFLADYPDYSVEVILCAYQPEELAEAERVFAQWMPGSV